MIEAKGRLALVAALAAALLFAGCIGSDGTPEDQQDADEEQLEEASGNQSDAAEAIDPWQGADRLAIVDYEHAYGVGGHETDILCTFGGGPQIPRLDDPIASGTGSLEVTVAVEPGWAGVQVGYVVDGTNAAHSGSEEGITWLESVPPGFEESFEVAVDETQTETGGERWSFYYQVNPGAEELCYTGAGVGPSSWSVTVDAVRG